MLNGGVTCVVNTVRASSHNQHEYMRRSRRCRSIPNTPYADLRGIQIQTPYEFADRLQSKPLQAPVDALVRYPPLPSIGFGGAGVIRSPCHAFVTQHAHLVARLVLATPCVS